jgi:hypothetical protein
MADIQSYSTYQLTAVSDTCRVIADGIQSELNSGSAGCRSVLSLKA